MFYSFEIWPSYRNFVVRCLEAIIKQLANMMQMHNAQASQECYNTERITLKLQV